MKKNKILSPCSASVQEYIVGYLQSEIKYLEKMQSLAVNASSVIKDNEEDPDEGIHLQMSVEELGLYTNVQKQAGILKNNNLRKLAKLLATTHRSLRKDNLSWQNLYNCFSKLEMSTINSLDDKLITMVNTLRKMKSNIRSN